MTSNRRIFTIGLAVAAPILLLGVLGSLVAMPRTRVMPAPLAPGRVVSLTTTTGVRIEADYWPGRTDAAPAVLLLHGIHASRAMFGAHAVWLNALGYAVLAPDFRGHGGSAAVARTFGWREAEDAAAAFDFLRHANPDRKIAVLGISLGGAAALLGQSGPLPADAMIVQAVYPTLRTAIANRVAKYAGGWAVRIGEPLLSFQSWPRYGVGPHRISPLAGLRRYPGPVLVIGGTRDLDTPVADTHSLFAAAPGPKWLWLVDGANHVETCGLWTDAYRTRVGDFLRQTIGAPV